MLVSRALRIRANDVVALVGAGGKTGTLFRLADELTARGQRVLSTTSTHIFVRQMEQAPAHFLLSDVKARPSISMLAQALRLDGHVFLGERIVAEHGKVKGLTPERIALLTPQISPDVVLIEADGARGLPFKAPADHEPVIPSSATIVIPVVGLDTLDRPLDADHVHRPHLMAAISGAKMGAPVTPTMIATVLTHPKGGAKGLPPGARLVPFLNKAETPERLCAAREVAATLLSNPRVDSVLIGAVHAADPIQEVWSRIGAVVLAAGEARRYGSLKQVIPWQGAPLVTHILDQVLACPEVERIAVTVGAEAPLVKAALANRAVHITPVADWHVGQSRSVQAGLREIQTSSGPGATSLGAVIFVLADQPGVSPELLSALIRRHRQTLASVVAPRYQEQRGNPVLFDRSTFSEFSSLQGDIGARPILEAHRDEIVWLDWPTPEVIQDIDTPADLVELSG